jgi:hypothetical protein
MPGMSIVVAQVAVSPAANTLNGQGWHQVAELGVALLLSAAFGVGLHAAFYLAAGMVIGAGILTVVTLRSRGAQYGRNP